MAPPWPPAILASKTEPTTFKMLLLSIAPPFIVALLLVKVELNMLTIPPLSIAPAPYA